MKTVTPIDVIYLIEERFKFVANISGNLAKYPIHKEDRITFATDKKKSRDHGEVFTPLYIVDEMISGLPYGVITPTSNNLDMCSGFGQFSIRMIRRLYEDYGSKFSLRKYLTQHHFFSELQVSSCYKLLWVFSTHINLFIGDSLKLGKLPDNTRGIWHYLDGLDEWVNVTGFVQALVKICGRKYTLESERLFVKTYESFINSLEKICKEHKMSIKHIVLTKAGRHLLLKYVNDAATGIEKNWQENDTPDWVVKEMLDCVPDIKKLKKILVLFNIEFLERLIKDQGVNPHKIDFGYDSDLEGLYAHAVYKVNSFSIGRSLEDMKAALDDKANQYDVVFSNPPYQIQSDAQKSRKGGGHRQAKPIYHEIVMYTIDILKPQYVCMITPSRWMVGGMGLKEYRVRMLADKHIRLIQDFPGNTEIFDKVSIQGGVSYFLWDRNYDGPCEFNGYQRDIGEFDVLIRDNISHQILKKVLTKHAQNNGSFCNEKVLPNKPFGLPTNFRDWVPEGTPGAVKCYCAVKEGFHNWVDSEHINDPHRVLGLWKVMTGAATYEGSSFVGGHKKVFTKIFVAEKGSTCIETYIVTGFFNTQKEAVNYAVYMETRFYRFMLSLRVISQHINTQKFSWVPDLGDYSKPWKDEELYQHFGLTKKEIEHIEKTIKAI